MALNIEQGNINNTYSYIPKSERGSDKPFTVKFRLLTLEEVAILQDKLILVHGNNSYNINSNSQTIEILRKALVDWLNVSNNSTPIKFETGNLELLALIPTSMRNEIADVILKSSMDASKVSEYIK